MLILLTPVSLVAETNNLEVCEIHYINQEDLINRGLNGLYNLFTGSSFLSQSLNETDLEHFINLGYLTRSNDSLSFDNLGLSFLTENKFAVFKDNNRFKVYFEYVEGSDRTILNFPAFAFDRIPSCKQLVRQIRKFTSIRFYFNESIKYFGNSLGLTYMALEALEKIKNNQTFDQNDWNASIRIYRSLIDVLTIRTENLTTSEQKIEEIRKHLLEVGLSKYRRAQTTILEFLNHGAGGNCVLRTNIFLALIIDLGINLEQNKLGVELFYDHIQAVVLNDKNQSTRDILTGYKTTPIKNPIYNPLWLKYNAFKKQSIFKLPFDSFEFLEPHPMLLHSPVNQPVETPNSFTYPEDVKTRLDIYDLNLAASNNYTSSPIPDSKDESYLSNPEYSFLSEAQSRSTTDETSLTNESSDPRYQLGNDSNVIDYSRPYFSKKNVQDSTLSESEKLDYYAMIDRGNFTEEDISNYGFHKIASILPFQLPSYARRSVFPPLNIYSGKSLDIGLTTTSLFVNHEILSSNEKSESTKQVEKIVPLIKGAIMKVDQEIQFLDSKLDQISAELTSYNQIFQLKDLIEKYNKIASMKFEFDFLTFGYKQNSILLRDILLHNGMTSTVEDIKNIEAEFLKFNIKLAKHFSHHSHELIALFNSRPERDYGSFLDIYGNGCRRFRSYFLAENASPYLNQPNLIDMIRQYILRNPDYYYSHNKSIELTFDDEVLNSNAVVSKTDRPQLNLPNVDWGFKNQQTCQSADQFGYVNYGGVAVDCSAEIQEERANLQNIFKNRKRYPLKPHILVALVSRFSYYNFLTPPEFLLLYYLWTPEHQSLSPATTKELLRGGLETVRNKTYISYRLSSNVNESCDSIIDLSDYNRCLLNLHSVKFDIMSESVRPMWVTDNPHLINLYDHMLANASAEIWSKGSMVKSEGSTQISDIAKIEITFNPKYKFQEGTQAKNLNSEDGLRLYYYIFFHGKNLYFNSYQQRVQDYHGLTIFTQDQKLNSELKSLWGNFDLTQFTSDFL